MMPHSGLEERRAKVKKAGWQVRSTYLAVQVADVAPCLQHPVTSLEDKDVQAAVGKREAPGRLQRDGENAPQQAAENPSMSHDDDRLPQMSLSQLFKAAEVALHLLSQALASR